ncbi:hypothetical protein CRI77_24855 [Mycolicibacterium duvalii]|uniref:Uncharacterized protein n=1 Tax=Mycolicibacterium duvalii TaxID=39688 RepID=A0A7I7JYD7_9MYCO|nr:hypothetical protein CRI77_24855 [Mycolicibacterium duvalii]BBX16927.1 hypothetical protein MDUV_17870 [Mycolicibacterium duvalii]
MPVRRFLRCLRFRVGPLLFRSRPRRRPLRRHPLRPSPARQEQPLAQVLRRPVRRSLRPQAKPVRVGPAVPVEPVLRLREPPVPSLPVALP